MKPFDASELDGRLLQLLVTVARTGSVTHTAEALGLTQSAVSHGLDRWRQCSGDPVVVKAGRGITLTPRARAMADQAEQLLRGLQALVAPVGFDPAACRDRLVIAANPLQRDLLLPPLLQHLQREAPGVTLRVVPSNAPSAERLRGDGLHLALSPRVPEDRDIRHSLLFTDRWCVFHDPGVRTAPATLDDYLAGGHVTVRYDDGRSLDIDRFLAERGHSRRLDVEVPEFSGVAAFLRGTDRLATLPSLTARHLMPGLVASPLPVPCPPLPMAAIWHQRFDDDPQHRWLRGALAAVAARV
jgi:DNA-binding transcriptional LysR family regulator